jgi:pimeloyl-ACP methyl ester carboxylesterase
VRLAYETAGPADGTPLLLVHGLATQMLLFHDDLVAELVARGFFVVRFDNRDIGLSTHLHDAPQPDLRAALKQGDTSTGGLPAGGHGRRRGRAARPPRPAGRPRARRLDGRHGGADARRSSTPIGC